MENTEDYKRIMGFIVPENKIKEETIISPTGKYKLVISYYKTTGWEYTCGEVFRLSDNILVCKIPRNYCDFYHAFFIKNQEEWLVTGMAYMSQTFVNLDKEQIYHDVVGEMYTETYKKGYSLCWYRMFASPDGNTLAVEACPWGGSYSIYFFDITDISKGWPMLEEEVSDCQESAYSKPPIWNEDNTFTIYNENEYKKLGSKNYHFQDDEYHDLPELQNVDEVTIIDSWYTFERRDNKMVLKSKCESDDKIRWMKKMNEE